MVTHPVPARVAPLIEFAFGDAIKIEYQNGFGAQLGPRVSVVGPLTHRRGHLLLQGNIESFVILFQPTGLQRLFATPISELVDNNYEARSVLGPFISGLEERLGDCSSFVERIRVTNEYLLPHALDECGPGTISMAARKILHRAGNVRIPTLADMTGLSTRQFERRFFQEVGISPKLYARIVRFEAALDCKARCPRKSWTNVAHEFEYHDQMHMIHDFGDFTGDAPMKVLGQVEEVFREQIRAMRSTQGLLATPSDERLIL
jgi:AraC-like DNA-binding protein